MPLPIDAVLPDLLAALDRANRAVLEAPPGAGKTTRVPLALLGAGWRGDGRIVVLEPRRLAARAAAARMAHTLEERVGETVGYRVRMESRVGPRTRVEVVTEGILTRWLQHDPGIEGVACVVFDEFHERSLQADTGLAFVLDAQTALRPDLRVLLMSATLDAARIGAWLGDGAPGGGTPAPVVRSEGRMFPVETRYLDAADLPPAGTRPIDRLALLVPSAVRAALAGTDGDVLAFLPGIGEIRRVAERLAGAQTAGAHTAGALPPGVRVHVLHGDLPLDAQDEAIRPAPPGERKVVLATSIAETSLTIEGVRAVVDGGFARVPRYSPRTGMTTLATVAVSRAAADQRRGRAGRLAPGVCFRLWTAADSERLAPALAPEILDADLAGLALELAAWGARDAAALRWLDAPPPAALATARALLERLGALARDGTITPHGRALAALGLHPRLGHLVVRGREAGHGPTACALAALLSERDVFRRGEGPPSPDLRLRLEALARGGHGADPNALRHLRDATRHLERRAGIALGGLRPGPIEPDAAGLLTAFAYPDRLAQRSAGARVRLASGQHADLTDAALVREDGFLAVAHLEGPAHAPRVALAAPISREDVERHFADRITTVVAVEWSARAERVVARKQKRLDALVLADAPLANPSPDAVADALVGAIRARGIGALPWTDAARTTQQRLAFARRLAPDVWPDVSDDVFLETLEDWLRPHVTGFWTLADLARLDLAALLLGRLDWSQRAALDRLAPTHIGVPSGSRIAVDYADPAAPALAVRLQEVFGLLDTPRVGDGRVPVTLHLLSPAHRPVQVTQDLRGFWATGYFDVRKDLRGRYPRHPWPEDPLAAEPTRRAKPRGT